VSIHRPLLSGQHWRNWTACLKLAYATATEFPLGCCPETHLCTPHSMMRAFSKTNAILGLVDV